MALGVVNALGSDAASAAESLAEGTAFAQAAIAAAEEAHAELEYRRNGLLIFLFFVVLVLVALGMKIRQT